MDVEISVLMAVYKGEKYLRESIESILNQSFSNFEFIIVNDASPDKSEAIILSYEDSRIVYIKHEQNRGLVAALNTGIDICKGKYIARMDQDDIAILDRLQLQCDFMNKNPEYILLGTQAEIINSKQTLEYPSTDKAIRAHLIFATTFIHPTVMLRKSKLDENNLRYSERYKHVEDYGFWIDVSAHGKMANLSYTGLYYRRHEEQYTVTFSKPMFDMVKEIKNKYMKSYGIVLNEYDLDLFEIITERRIDYTNEKSLYEIGEFLNRFSNYFLETTLSTHIIKDICYNLWKRICDERQKSGLRVFKIYISNPLYRFKWEWKVLLHLLKQDFNVMRR